MIKLVWQRFYENGVFVYESFSIADKAFGAGMEYYEDGTPLHEGIFGIKGLLSGKEYYPNGQVRFEGVYRLNRAYGPNWPEYGTWYNENGQELYHGEFKISRGGIGYPTVVEPEGFGPAAYHTSLGTHLFKWEDEEKNIKQTQ